MARPVEHVGALLVVRSVAVEAGSALLDLLAVAELARARVRRSGGTVVGRGCRSVAGSRRGGRFGIAAAAAFTARAVAGERSNLGAGELVAVKVVGVGNEDTGVGVIVCAREGDELVIGGVARTATTNFDLDAGGIELGA